MKKLLVFLALLFASPAQEVAGTRTVNIPN
jgi:hypothetical protein